MKHLRPYFPIGFAFLSGLNVDAALTFEDNFQFIAMGIVFGMLAVGFQSLHRCHEVAA